MARLTSSSSGKGKLLDQVRETLRRKHYSIRTEDAYIQWIRRFILFYGKRHPLEMGQQKLAQTELKQAQITAIWAMVEFNTWSDTWIPPLLARCI